MGYIVITSPQEVGILVRAADGGGLVLHLGNADEPITSSGLANNGTCLKSKNVVWYSSGVSCSIAAILFYKGIRYWGGGGVKKKIRGWLGVFGWQFIIVC